MAEEERQITVYVRIQIVRPPVWVKEFKQLCRQSQAQLLRESASRITQIHAFSVPASYQHQKKSLQDAILRDLAYEALRANGLCSSGSFVFEDAVLVTTKDRYDQYVKDCLYMRAAQSATT